MFHRPTRWPYKAQNTTEDPAKSYLHNVRLDIYKFVKQKKEQVLLVAFIFNLLKSFGLLKDSTESTFKSQKAMWKWTGLIKRKMSEENL